MKCGACATHMPLDLITDLDAIFRDIKEQEKKSGRKFVSFPPRRLESNQPPKPIGSA